MNKKRILLVLRILIIITAVISGGFAWYFWNQEMPMKAVLCGMGGAMIVFNFIIAMFLINRNIKK
ncbi:MAG: hypothetical protein RR202_13705 [Bacteroidales bacterium]